MAGVGTGLSLVDFEQLVDAHVTPHMARLGYARIGAYSGESSRTLLVAERRGGFWRQVRRLQGRKRRQRGPVEYAMGYEALSEEAMSRVMPDDPLSADEVWLCLDTTSGDLDFHLGARLEDLAMRFGTVEERDVLVAAEAPVAERLSVLDRLLSRLPTAS